MPDIVIEAAELQARLDNPQTVVVDCRFNLAQPDAGRQLYAQGHIPGAVYAHLDDDLAARPLPEQGRHPLPAPEDFAATLGRLGITTDSQVIVYDDCGGAIAARLWWMLGWINHPHRALLNGGIQAWTAAGFELQDGVDAPAPAHYALLGCNVAAIADTDEIAALSKAASPQMTLLDARAAPRFRGEVEPIDPVAGHVPGALNLPFNELLDADQRFLDEPALTARFDALLSGSADALPITMCGSGVTGCHLLVGLALIGREGRLYPGSWSEWIRDPQRPVATAD